ncbi:MAG TPA: hypothetical protein VK171_00185 [Fimbriimonas sp.]|nr:hypothetical protein [Fimbriimonas sp.]
MSFLFELLGHVVSLVIQLALNLVGHWVENRISGSFDWAGRKVTGLYDWIIG